ncbi:MAG: heparinase II/III family protein, partial [Planctomycetia bacterium]|nr:heparinase II/III family protein [Planctomycetia bacterium]
TLHFLYPLEEAYRITKEEKYAEAWQTIFNRWWDQREAIAGPMVGKPNKDPLVHELDSSFRIQWLIRMWPKLKDSPSITPQTYARWMKSILGMGRWMYSHQYRRWRAGGWSGNWAFTGCEGLFHAGLFLQEFPEARDWTRLAARQVRFAMTKDFYADGGHSERSFQYDLISLAVCSKILRLMNLNDLWPEMRGDYADRMRVIYRWWLNVCGPGGLAPGVGDSGVINLAHTLLGGADICREPEFLWPVRSKLWAEKVREAKMPAYTSVLMPSSKFAVLRNGWEDDSAYMLINYGEGSASHAHEDCLSFSIMAHGRPLAMDPGVAPSYNHPTHKPWYYAARSHNMVIVDDSTPSEADNEGMLKLWATHTEVDIFQGEHRAFQRQKGVVSERTVFFSRRRGCWFIIDRMSQAGGEHFYRWHINSPFPLKKQGAGTIVSVEAPGMVVRMAEPEALAELRMGRGPSNVRNILEGVEHQNTYIADFEKRGKGNVTVVFGALIAPFDEKPEDATVSALPGTGEGRGFIVRFEDGSEEYFIVGETEERETSFGPVRTDAQAAWLRVAEGQVKAAAIWKGTFLDFKGARLMKSPIRLEAVQVCWLEEKVEVQARHFGALEIRAPSAKSVTWNGEAARFQKKDDNVTLDETGAVWATIEQDVIREAGQPLVINVHNYSDKKIDGDVQLTITDLDQRPVKAVVIEPGSSRQISFKIDVPMDSRQIDYPLTATLSTTGKPLLRGTMKVAPRLVAGRRLIWRLLPTRASRAGGAGPSKAEVLLEIENRSHIAIKVEATVVLSGVKQDVTKRIIEALAPFSKKVLGFPFEQSGAPEAVTGELTLRTENGEVKKKLSVDIPLVKRFTSAPEIDAQLSEWKGASPLHLNRPEQVVYRRGGRRAGISAVAFAGYDKDNLYFAFDVSDPDVLPNRRGGATPWEGTGIELYLDTRQAPNLGQGVYNREVFQIYLIPGNGKDIQAHFTRRPYRPRGAKIASAKTARGYVLEASIPWHNFPWRTAERVGVIGLGPAVSSRPAGGGG